MEITSASYYGVLVHKFSSRFLLRCVIFLLVFPSPSQDLLYNIFSTSYLIGFKLIVYHSMDYDMNHGNNL